MKRWFGSKTARGFVFLFVFALAALPAQATIRYAVSVAQPDKHLFHITMTIPDVQREVVVQLPAWNALYQVRDFAQHLIAVRAQDAASHSLAVIKVDKQTWRVAGDGTVTVRYVAYWDEPGPFSSQLNSAHAFVNLATLLLYVPDRRSEDARIEFDDLPAAWRVAVALRPEKGPGTPAYVAPNYDALVDAPVELGAFEEFRLEATTPPVRVVVHGEGADGAAREKIAESLRRIVAYETQLMRGAPYEEYLFIYHLGSAAAGAGGGMEHANSTAIFLHSAAQLPNVTAHEFFHLWNVKRIRPASLDPVDYTREQWTRALWFAEGVTNTYGSYALVRAGLWDRKQFYEDLAQQIAELESRPARRWKSVEEASLDAWFEKYAAYRRPEFSISYYNKGQILGVLLDILIRDATDNRASLDDVLRELNENYARRGRSYRDSADIRAAAEAVLRRTNAARGASRVPAGMAPAGQGFGGDPAEPDPVLGATDDSGILAQFFSLYVAGTDELPCAELLARAGLALKAQGRGRAEFGFLATRGPGGPSAATQVAPGSPAEQAGVREGDVLLALNGSVFPHSAERWLREHRPGETVRVLVQREGEKKEFAFTLGEQQERNYQIEEAGNATRKQKRIREGILSGTTDPARR